ncbi:MAG TPA: hypothetical protein VLL75_12325 [Vicinamibacteria bacterium]|nr:hypothetical protein [Vicinamibacteria bacterium]
MRSDGPPPRGRARPFLLATVLLLGSRAAFPEVVERVLAAVDRRPIMLSEVSALEALRGFAREAAIEAAIDEHLMFREASRMPSAAAAASREDEALGEVLGAHPGLRGRVPEEEIRRVLRRQAVILKYVDLRFLPQVRLGDDVVREAYDAEYAGRADAPPFEEASSAVRAKLVRRDLDARIEGWVKELRAGAEIRYNP